MSAPVATASSVLDLQGLAELRAQSKDGGEDNLKEVAAQFESLFIQMMLKSMRDASPAEDEIFNSDAMKQYRDMMDQQLALDMARKGGVGLADHIVSQLGGGEPPVPTSPPGQSYVAVAHQISTIASQRPVAMKGEDWRPDSPEAFIRDLLPRANKASEELGVPAEAIVAQAALETGWGRNVIRTPDGGNSLNLFGIKADSNWDGDRVIVPTLEYRGGIAQRENAAFRSYASLSASMDDYTNFLQSSPRYRQALDNAADADGFLQELQGAGYATDPVYASKIAAILDRTDFIRSVDQLRAGDITVDPQAS